MVAVAAVDMSGGVICTPRPRFYDRYTWRAGVSYNLTNCTKTKLSSFHQYFTPLQFNVLKSRVGLHRQTVVRRAERSDEFLSHYHPTPPITPFSNSATLPFPPPLLYLQICGYELPQTFRLDYPHI